MASSKIIANKPHALIIPFPLQGHIKTMLKLAKLLHSRGFHITFVNSEFNHNRFLHSRGPNSMDGLPDFQFETIPDSLPPSDLENTQHIPALCEAVMNKFFQPFLDLVVRIQENGSSRGDVPPLTCIIADGFCSTFTVKAAREVELPVVIFFTMCAAAVMGFKHFVALKEKGITPLKDESYQTNGYLDSTVDWIPGMMKGIRLKDLPSLFRTTDPDDLLFTFTMECAENAVKATAVGFETFDALEKDVLAAFPSIFPPAYTIGPLQFHLNQGTHSLDSIGYNLWKEDTDCLQWLDSFEPDSVVYVNFGSVTIMSQQQLIEFGMGLASSKHPFLWIIRRDLVIGDSAILPPEFFEQTKERSRIALWCPQEEVLNHPSIGGFLTHSGWGSTMESLSAGVPMLCWPFFADQPTNCKYTCDKWGVGMEIDNNVKRDEVEKLVRELMEGEKGKEMRNKAMEWKKLAEEATSPNGSSTLNLEKMINEVLLPKN